jgi:hypothetical protein
MKAEMVSGKKLTLVPVLRAGLGMVEGMLRLMPSVRVGHIGLYRDHDTLQPVDYYFKIPGDAEAATSSCWTPCSPPAGPRRRPWRPSSAAAAPPRPAALPGGRAGRRAAHARRPPGRAGLHAALDRN